METTKLAPHLDPHVARKLFSRTRLDPVSGCLLWTGANTDGYGTVRIGDRIRSAHRLALEIGLRRALEPHERATPATTRAVSAPRLATSSSARTRST